MLWPEQKAICSCLAILMDRLSVSIKRARSHGYNSCKHKTWTVKLTAIIHLTNTDYSISLFPISKFGCICHILSPHQLPQNNTDYKVCLHLFRNLDSTTAFILKHETRVGIVCFTLGCHQQKPSWHIPITSRINFLLH